MKLITALLFLAISSQAFADVSCSTPIGKFESFASVQIEGDVVHQTLTLLEDGKFIWFRSDFGIHGTYITSTDNDSCKLSIQHNGQKELKSGIYVPSSGLLLWEGVWFHPKARE